MRLATALLDTELVDDYNTIKYGKHMQLQSIFGYVPRATCPYEPFMTQRRKAVDENRSRKI